jgi:hypothetical protein
MEMYFDKSEEFDVVAVGGGGGGGGRKNEQGSKSSKNNNNNTMPYNSKFVRKYENRINNK